MDDVDDDCADMLKRGNVVLVTIRNSQHARQNAREQIQNHVVCINRFSLLQVPVDVDAADDDDDLAG